MSNYRGRLQIIRDILVVVASRDGCKKTHIMYGANLSYKLLLQYLQDTLKAGLLVYDANSSYSITERGRTFLEMHEEYERRRRKLNEHINSLEAGEDSLNKMLNT